tara:strand:- start:153 stop:434 length:282 start_codon:yes stop_codon:yes gene_type:complete
MNSINKELKHFRNSIDFKEALRRAIKYLTEGAAVAVAAYYIPKDRLEIEEVVLIAVTAAATFALLDMYAPSIGDYARKGTGFGIGANIAGFPR